MTDVTELSGGKLSHGLKIDDDSKSPLTEVLHQLKKAPPAEVTADRIVDQHRIDRAQPPHQRNDPLSHHECQVRLRIMPTQSRQDRGREKHIADAIGTYDENFKSRTFRHSSSPQALSNLFFHPGHDLVESELAGIELNRIRRPLQGRDSPSTVSFVTHRDLRFHLLERRRVRP